MRRERGDDRNRVRAVIRRVMVASGAYLPANREVSMIVARSRNRRKTPRSCQKPLVSSKNSRGRMKTYEFNVMLKNVAEITDDQADSLFAAGCDDGSPVSRDGVAWVHFDRKADSLENAIRSAVAQVQAAGLVVAKVEIAADAVAVSN